MNFIKALLSEVSVIVYVVFTEAVVALAARAVSELQIGILRVGPAADGAFVVIQIFRLFPADFSCRFLEIDGLRSLFPNVKRLQ